jgi:FemAB-related protein (PEP-CTERM system-associated)
VSAYAEAMADAERPRLDAVTVESAPEEWTAFVRQHPGATGYHDWKWRDVFKQAFGHESIYLAVRSHGQITGVLPLVLLDSWLFGRSLISLPFVNYGGVLAADPTAARALLDHAARIAEERDCRHIELRHTTQQFSDLPCKRHKVCMVLDLGPAPAMWDRLDRKVRNQIRKAQKSGLTIHAGGLDLLDEFYAVFARNMRDLGTPVYGREFFEQVLTVFPERARVQLVRLGAKAVAAGITYRTGERTEVPWASSVREFNSLCPNHLLYWGAVERAAADGCRIFDFGRSTPNEGTYRFKEQWGAKPLPLCWEYRLQPGASLPNATPSNPKFSLAVSLWKKLPVGLATRIGPSIVRVIPS